MLRRALGISATEVVFVAGSTMEGEEEAALAAYRSARRNHPRLRLVLVPRHSDRFERVATWLRLEGEVVIRRSMPGAPVPVSDCPPVVLVDTLGELSAVWGMADVAFVGGSLFPGRSGQNMMEPAAFGAAVLFGPYTDNFRGTVEELLGLGAARVVADSATLAQALADDLDDPEAAAARGAAARTFVLAQNGAAERTIAELDRLVESVNGEKSA
jgi:3-deoxy-D-manno-octulosonic-acid transferase